jgi:hypothetical protein
MTTRLFNPGPSPFTSPDGGVFAPGEHFTAEQNSVIFSAVNRGRLLLVDDPIQAATVATADPDDAPAQEGGDEIVEVESTEEIVIDDDAQASAPKPGPTKKATAKTAPADKD